MTLTEKQKNLLRWIVKEVRADHLPEDCIWYITTLTDCGWVDYKGSDSHPYVEFATFDILEEYGYIKWQQKSQHQYKGALTGKAYEAVDSNFDEPDRSAIPHLIPLTEVEHLDSELWERVSNKSVQKDQLPSEELEAYRDLYSGTMKRFRNPYAHRFIDPKPEEGGAIIVFIDLLLKMLDDLDWETENENT